MSIERIMDRIFGGIIIIYIRKVMNTKVFTMQWSSLILTKWKLTLTGKMAAYKSALFKGIDSA